MSREPDRVEEKPAHLDRLSALWRRLNDHKVVQWSVAYVALAYAIQHAIILTGESFEWPNAVARVSMLLLALGLPLVVTLAWYHGARASRNFSQAELSILAVLLVMSSLLFYVFVQPSGEAAAPVQASVTAARNAAASPKGAISVAVLPFVNLSSDKEQEFFSDGMTEEITSALAKVPDLRVVARTSAFEFKGQNKDIQAIGQQLHATHLIEGSVRKAGNRVRITAQLIKADDGTHLWAEDYDRDLTDIFAIQEEIARAITASLRMPLGLKPGENLVTSRDIDPESHETFLRAKALIDSRGGLQDYERAELLFNEVVGKSPNYAPAWGLLSPLYYLTAGAHASNAGEPIAAARARIDELRAKGEAAARRAIEYDPNLAAGHYGLAIFAWSRGKHLEAEGFLNKALALDPNDSNTLVGYGDWIGSVGRPKEALASFEKARAIEPFQPAILRRTAEYRWVNGQNESAIALAKSLQPIDRAYTLAMVYASMGRYGEAADALMEFASDPNSAATQAAHLLRTAPAKTASPDKLPRFPVNLEFSYLHVGALDRAIATYERRAGVGFFVAAQGTQVAPTYAAVRKTQGFKAYVRNAGLVDYWHAKGWPAQCHPTTGDDFACE